MSRAPAAALAAALLLTACAPKANAPEAPPPAAADGGVEVSRGAAPSGTDARLHGAANYERPAAKLLVVSGILRDSATSRSIPGANVRLVSTEADGRSYAGVTDPAGRFRFSEIPPGGYVLDVVAYGYAEHRDWLALASDGGEVELPIDLDPEALSTGYRHFRPAPDGGLQR